MDEMAQMAADVFAQMSSDAPAHGSHPRPEAWTDHPLLQVEAELLAPADPPGSVPLPAAGRAERWVRAHAGQTALLATAVAGGVARTMRRRHRRAR